MIQHRHVVGDFLHCPHSTYSFAKLVEQRSVRTRARHSRCQGGYIIMGNQQSVAPVADEFFYAPQIRAYHRCSRRKRLEYHQRPRLKPLRWDHEDINFGKKLL